MTYRLDPEKKAFSYTREELFSCIAKDLPSEETMESIKRLMNRPSPWSEQ